MNLEIVRKMDRIHPYPAKFTVDLAINYIEKYSKVNDTIYDPFLGSGTTLLAAKYLKRNGVGTDINYIAILISRFKALNLTDDDFKQLNVFINKIKNTSIDKIKNTELIFYKSVDHWFCFDAICFLSYLKHQIKLLNNYNQIIFCNTIMSSIINTISNQESDTRYAAIVKPKVNILFCKDLFVKKFEYSLDLCANMQKNSFSEDIYLHNSKNCNDIIKEKSVDLVLTSPPYPNTYDYYLYHKHRMKWLEYDVNYSMQEEIGSRREYSSLKHTKDKFNKDMFEILYAVNKTLKIGGYAVLVMGDGKINGELYEAKSNLESICQKLNWKLIDYSFTYLDHTSRSFQKTFREKGKKEHVMVFIKES